MVEVFEAPFGLSNVGSAARFISWFFNPPVAWLSPEKVVIKMGVYPISRQTEIVVVSFISYYIPIKSDSNHTACGETIILNYNIYNIYIYICNIIYMYIYIYLHDRTICAGAIHVSCSTVSPNISRELAEEKQGK